MPSPRPPRPRSPLAWSESTAARPDGACQQARRIGTVCYPRGTGSSFVLVTACSTMVAPGAQMPGGGWLDENANDACPRPDLDALDELAVPLRQAGHWSNHGRGRSRGPGSCATPPRRGFRPYRRRCRACATTVADRGSVSLDMADHASCPYCYRAAAFAWVWIDRDRTGRPMQAIRHPGASRLSPSGPRQCRKRGAATAICHRLPSANCPVPRRSDMTGVATTRSWRFHRYADDLAD